ncbi:MAG: 16S rRNA (uracil(1498)-N(3))-methyltransferase [Desulfosalsimonas sp.]
MTSRRFYIEPGQADRPEPRLTGRQAAHIRKVLRLSEGDRISLVDGTGLAFEARITGVGSDSVSVEITGRTSMQNESGLQIAVAQGFLKENRMDDLVRQITELGAAKWIPLFTERTVARPDKKRMEKRLKRWQSIAMEAVKQCGRSLAPEIRMPAGLGEVLDMARDVDLPLFFHENAGTALPSDPQIRPDSVLLVLGPEGGFTEDEASKARKQGFYFAGLGPRVLRAETAAVTACSLAQYMYGDLQKSP